MTRLSQNVLEHFLPAKIPANGLTSKIDELTSAPNNFIVIFRLSKNSFLCTGVKNQVSSPGPKDYVNFILMFNNIQKR